MIRILGMVHIAIICCDFYRRPSTLWLLMPPIMPHTRGLWIPWSRRYNYKNVMQMVGPPGLEPGTKGL